MKSNKSVLLWLIVGAILVGSMVVIGGVTRLTNSGLSMVEWKLIMGAVPPLSNEEWQTTFEKYKESPEYIKINNDFTLEEFKSIFWWEYAHRLLGRIIGIVFLIPFIIFWAKEYFKELGFGKYILLFLGGAFQGFLGWFMVKSGLVDNPDVSHYRLAIHLIAALLLFSYIIWLILDLVRYKRRTLTVPVLPSTLWTLFLLFLVQIIYGAFIAGLNAGPFYPTFPTMNGEWIPVLLSEQMQKDGMVSLVNNVTSVQFIHRWLGIALLVGLFYVYYIFRHSMLNIHKKNFRALIIVVCIQVIFGVSALLLSVPFTLAIVHQFMALVILGVLIINLHGLYYQKLEKA